MIGRVETVEPTAVSNEWRKLHPAVCKVWRYSAMLTGIIPTVFITGMAAMFTRLAHGPTAIIAIAVGVSCLLLFMALPMLLAEKQYNRWRYMLTPESLVVRKGLLYQSERYIARDRVQHIDVNSGPFDRKFGLVQVVIYAAGITGSVGLIPGLTPEEGDSLRAQLIPTNATEVDESSAAPIADPSPPTDEAAAASGSSPSTGPNDDGTA